MTEASYDDINYECQAIAAIRELLKDGQSDGSNQEIGMGVSLIIRDHGDYYGYTFRTSEGATLRGGPIDKKDLPNTRKCNFCGGEFIPGDVMAERPDKYCSSCSFWMPHMKDCDSDPKHNPVINGQKYIIADEDKTCFGSRGYGGQEFIIKWLDSEYAVRTTNLWHNGRIPQIFRNDMPNTAEFVKTTIPYAGKTRGNITVCPKCGSPGGELTGETAGDSYDEYSAEMDCKCGAKWWIVYKFDFIEYDGVRL